MELDARRGRSRPPQRAARADDWRALPNRSAPFAARASPPSLARTPRPVPPGPWPPRRRAGRPTRRPGSARVGRAREAAKGTTPGTRPRTGGRTRPRTPNDGPVAAPGGPAGLPGRRTTCPARARRRPRRRNAGFPGLSPRAPERLSPLGGARGRQDDPPPSRRRHGGGTPRRRAALQRARPLQRPWKPGLGQAARRSEQKDSARPEAAGETPVARDLRRTRTAGGRGRAHGGWGPCAGIGAGRVAGHKARPRKRFASEKAASGGVPPPEAGGEDGGRATGHARGGAWRRPPSAPDVRPVTGPRSSSQ